MVLRWVYVSLAGLGMFGSANRLAVSAAEEVPVAATVVEKTKSMTPRQEDWLRGTPEQRARLSELLGEEGGRALAKKNGHVAICDGLERTLPQGPDQVYRAADGRIVVYEVKGGSSPLGRAYGYQQGTPEWAVESANRVLKSARAGQAEKEAARGILKAAAEHRLTVEVVRTKHVLGEPFAAAVEQSLSATDDAARLARAAVDGLARPAVTRIDDAGRAAPQLADDAGRLTGELAKAAPRAKIVRGASKALVPVGLVIDGTCRVNDAKAVERRFGSGEITQQQREIEHAKNGAGFVGGWGGACAGAQMGAATGGAVGTVVAPGPGTAIGAASGGAAGGVAGYFAGEAAAARVADWTVNKIHRTGNTLQSAWHWAFGR